MTHVETSADADRAVLARMAAGETAALAELYDTHARAVYTLAVRVVGDRTEAEDVAQEVFAQAWRQASRYDDSRATVIGWLLMITRARGLDHVRARRARPDMGSRVEMPDVPSAELGQETMVVTQQAAKRTRAALDELGEPFRTLIELAYYEGLSQSAIAAQLGQPLGTVKARTRTALLRLRNVLRAEGN